LGQKSTQGGMAMITLDNLDKTNLGDYAKEQIRRSLAGGSRFNAAACDKKAAPRNRASDTAANVEQYFVNATLPAYAGEKFNSPVRVDIYSTRCRKTDIDNISGKALLDGCVKSGIFTDDSPEYIRQYQVHNPEIGEEEKTLIVIEEI
jgi:Holliday junction resolvase RusA-like endonuclease